MSKDQALLKSYNLNGLELPNRVVMAPMTRSRADNEGNVPTVDLQGEYYKQRASAGLIISEGSQVSEEAVGYIHTPGIHTEAQVEGWKKVTDIVHQEGGRIFIQLWHVGRMSHPDFHNGKKPLAPSAINPNSKSFTPEGFKDTVTPQEMSLQVDYKCKQQRAEQRTQDNCGCQGAPVAHVIEHLLAEHGIGKHCLHQVLAIIEMPFHGKRMDIVGAECGHLPLLDR